ncbi:MAG: thioredoxin family protein [Odoribacter sp.]|nr:thioredoxin family protein [Odoribacter sp.]
MKRLLCIICISFFAFSISAQEAGKGIVFLEGENWEKVLELASKEGKCIFMDCYTSWCGPCKALAKDIFTREDVGDFFNASFVNVKYDMEKGEGKKLREKYQEHIIGYPTLLLLDAKGEVLHRMAGFQQAEALIDGMKAGKEGESLYALRKRYQQGEREVDFLKKYMAALNGAFLREDMEKVVNEYMNRIPLDSLKSKEIWDFVWTYIKDPYSPQFAYVVDNLTHYRYRMKTDMYALESQLVYALGRGVRECTALKKDEDGKVIGLTDEPEKVEILTRLLGKAELKQKAEYCAKLRIHELELKEDWEKVYEYLMVGHDIGTLGSELYMDDVFQYMAFRCSNTKLLKKVLAVVEGLQQEADQSNKRMKNSYYQTLGMLYEKLRNSSKAEEYYEKERVRTEELRKDFEKMMNKKD